MNLNEMGEEFKKKDDFIIISHHNADVDAVSSLLALRELLEKQGKKVHVGVAESISEVARNFLKNEEILINPKLDKYENIIIVDTSAPEQIKPMVIPRNKNVFLLDHHIPGNLVKISKSYIDPNAKSCSEIIYKLSKYFSDLSQRSSFLLASGIVYDTAHLRNADIKVFKILVELLEKSGREFKEIIKLLNTDIDISEKIANLKAVGRLKSYRIGNVLVSFTHTGSFEASVARNLLKMGSDIAIVAAPKKKSLRISGRMKSNLRNKINLAEIFSQIEEIIDGSAGGHDMAASANGKNTNNVGKAFDKILSLIEKKMGERAKKL